MGFGNDRKGDAGNIGNRGCGELMIGFIAVLAGVILLIVGLS